MAQVKETPLFIMDSELSVFNQHHPDYNYYTKVFYKDGALAGYLAYKEDPSK